jgi:hypothetical protein
MLNRGLVPSAVYSDITAQDEDVEREQNWDRVSETNTHTPTI